MSRRKGDMESGSEDKAAGQNQNGRCQREFGCQQSSSKQNFAEGRSQLIKEPCRPSLDDLGSEGVSNFAFLPDDNIDDVKKRTPQLSNTSSTLSGGSPDSACDICGKKSELEAMEKGQESCRLAPTVDSEKSFTQLSVCSGELNNVGKKHSESHDIFSNKKEPIRINIARDAVDLYELHSTYGIQPTDVPLHKKFFRYVKSECLCRLPCLLSFITSLFPVIRWLPKYKIKEDLVLDIIAGFTIAILHIPQGMAYGLLASAEAINGLYVSFFPVLVYFLMGTSRHISIGTFAVISLMIKSTTEKLKVAHEWKDHDSHKNDTNSANMSTTTTAPLEITHMEILTAMAIAVGLWQIFMGVFRLGGLTVLLSDHLISGFSTGAACHVATSQLPDLFGIKIQSHNGPLKLIYSYIDIFSNLRHSNLASVIISATSIFALALVKEQINARFRSKLKLPVPIDLIVVILATLASYFGDFYKKYDVKIMGNIPTGLPAPSPPRIDLLPKIVSDSFAVAIVAYAISLSMAKIFSKKHKYPINANQELIALGSANVFSSFFACYPCSASLSRSLVQERAGGKTQVAGLVSCGFLLIVLLALAPLFYTLPKCILSAVILVALKGMFLQVTDLNKAWYISRIDALIWLITFFAVVLLDVDYGLLTGLIFSVITVVYRTAMPSMSFLGKLPNTELYLDTMRYNKAIEIKGVIIFHFESALYFANRERFKHEILNEVSKNDRNNINFKTWIVRPTSSIHHVVIDCSSFSYIDMAGVETLLEIYTELKEMDITMYLAGCSVPVYEILVKTEYLKKTCYPSIFPSIHDAVQYC